MAANNAYIPDDLLNEVSAAARAEGKTSEEWRTETIRARIADRRWQDLVSQVRPYIGDASDAELETARGEYRKGHSARRQ
jgi:hypothetical protein